MWGETVAFRFCFVVFGFFCQQLKCAGKEQPGVLAATHLTAKLSLPSIPPPLSFLAPAQGRLSVCTPLPPPTSSRCGYLTAIKYSLQQKVVERYYYGLELWCLGTCLHNESFVWLCYSGCWRKKPGVLEDARVCWERLGESAKGMSLT